MCDRRGFGWGACAAIGILTLVVSGAIYVVPAPISWDRGGTPGATATSRAGDLPETLATSAADSYAVLNESTLALFNDTFVPGDFFSTSAGLPSLEAFDPQTNEVFVESFYSGVIDVISGGSNRVVASIPTGAYPNTIAYDPANHNVYFGLQTDDEVSVVNATTDLIERTVGIGIEPLSMAADPVNGDLFVTGVNATGTAIVAVLGGSSGVLLKEFSFGNDRFPVAGPNGLVYDPAQQEFYVPSIPTGDASATRGNLTVVRASSESDVKNISLSFEPSSILYVPTNGEFYLGNASGDTLRIFDPVAGRLNGSVSLPNLPSMLAYGSTNADIFVGLEGNVSVVSTATNAVVRTFPVDRNPDGLAYDSHNLDLYISDYVWNNVSVVSTKSYDVVGAALLGAAPYDMAFDPTDGDLYIGDLLSVQLLVVSGATNRVIDRIPLGTTPYGVAYDPITKDVYVDDYYAGNVSIVDPSLNRVVGHLPAGTNPWGIAYDGTDQDLYVTNPGSNNITVLDPTTDKVATSINLTTAPGAIAYDPKGPTLFVGEYDADNVSVLNARTNALVRNSSVGTEPYTIATDPISGRAFVGNYGSDNVTVLGPEGTELGISAAAGVGVFGSAFDPADGDVYVASFYSDLVTVINGTTGAGVGGYEVGSGPAGVAVDAKSGMVFVSNYDSGSLTLLSPTFQLRTYAVVFEESGLPAGTYWWVRLNGVGETTTTANLTFDVVNGTGLAYAVDAVPGYSVHPQFGTLTVDGGKVIVKITFETDRK
jgi:YVTN family beta-propeller protein